MNQRSVKKLHVNLENHGTVRLRNRRSSRSSVKLDDSGDSTNEIVAEQADRKAAKEHRAKNMAHFKK